MVYSHARSRVDLATELTSLHGILTNLTRALIALKTERVSFRPVSETTQTLLLETMAALKTTLAYEANGSNVRHVSPAMPNPYIRLLWDVQEALRERPRLNRLYSPGHPLVRTMLQISRVLQQKARMETVGNEPYFQSAMALLAALQQRLG